MNSKWYIPAGSATAPLTVDVTPESAGWSESSLFVAELGAGESLTRTTGPDEIIVVPLSGSASVASGDTTFELTGRASVFDRPSDFAYVGRDSEFTLTSSAGGRFALCGARASKSLPFRYVPAADVPVELRGAGNCSRQVHNFGTADAFEADSIIACEVITPGGNWSSYPAHKHDENSDVESQLEEIYYFEISEGPDGTAGFGYHRVYGTPERPIEVLEEVRSGDVVLVPHGYHGPSIAAPGYHMYYLNVMAGPGDERAWRICDDPAHTWLRGSWEHREIDPRLPLHGPAR
ncbi:5-deoxy-glucuronate isomerase [Gordonia sp. ABSL49_1]|uniref:5-deoxy-glucuronate isomerase n=1 Tax=Gordonia sp. ABSL49_1 TaxID=2920941 RepID=UPI001F0E3B0E|nr:5-deoxy-glucuronate isomerase [Gordonia sp. ABSL49_1]MCH5642303.1 5-deoxy-glucuronate isomerase [Gordonia sp. ABSL49_1]